MSREKGGGQVRVGERVGSPWSVVEPKPRTSLQELTTVTTVGTIVTLVVSVTAWSTERFVSAKTLTKKESGGSLGH